jgi:two-component system sensor histidine kinase QseC
MTLSRSLHWRVGAVMVLVVVAMYAVLMLGISYTMLKRGTGDIDSEFAAGAKQLAELLDDLGTERDAQLLIGMFNKWSNAQRGDAPGISILATSLRTGQHYVVGRPANTARWQTLTPGQLDLQDGQVRYRAYTARTGQWQVSFIDDIDIRRSQLLAEIASDLLRYLTWVLPLMLIPVWFSIRSALAPIGTLTLAIQSRKPDATDPLQVGRVYAELAPLIDALNAQFRRAAQHLSREREFVHDAAHELRTPLAVISAQAHVLAQAQEPERQAARLQLELALERAAHLTQQLLQLARAEAPQPPGDEALDLMRLLRECVAQFGPRADQLGAELTLDGPDVLRIHTQPVLLRSAIENLLDNALRHGQPAQGGGPVEIRVMPAEGEQVRISVADRGPGIPEADREQAFERFWRANRSDGRGSGLGLAIVRESVRALGGEVRIQARPDGPGCEVCVALPSGNAHAAGSLR